MNSSSSTSIASALAILALAAAPPVARAQGSTYAEMEAAAANVRAAAREADNIDEAAVFMEEYAADLRAGNRAAIADRYDRSGAWRQGNGDNVLEPWDRIRDIYAGARWERPASFEWRDLHYEPAGPDAVVVVGTFLWGRAAGQPPYLFSYTALLVHRDGRLRIRLEHESMRPVLAEPAH
jgi:hypothetical protein